MKDNIKDAIKAFREGKRPEDRFVKTKDGKVEIPLSKEFKENLDRVGKSLKISSQDDLDKFTEEAISKYTKKIESYNMTILEGIYKLFNVAETDRLKSFQVLRKFLENEYHTSTEDSTNGTKEQQAYASNIIQIHKYIIQPVLENIKLFELEDEVVPVLQLHDVYEGKFPFPSIGIDCKVNLKVGKEDRLYLGFLIGSYFTEDNISYHGVTTVYGVRDNEGKYRLKHDFFVLEKEISKQIFKDVRINDYKQVRSFIYAFLNYINSPDVTIKEIEFSKKNNERRVERGRMPLPSSNKIYIHGVQLRKYVDEINAGVKRVGLTHRFWVRGHYGHFRDKKRYKLIYSLTSEELQRKGYEKLDNGLIRKWRGSFLKGEGLLLDKTYRVGK